MSASGGLGTKPPSAPRLHSNQFEPDAHPLLSALCCCLPLLLSALCFSWSYLSTKNSVLHLRAPIPIKNKNPHKYQSLEPSTLSSHPRVLKCLFFLLHTCVNPIAYLCPYLPASLLPYITASFSHLCPNTRLSNNPTLLSPIHEIFACMKASSRGAVNTRGGGGAHTPAAGPCAPLHTRLLPQKKNKRD